MKKYGWMLNGLEVKDTYENWRAYLVDRSGDLRALDMATAYTLYESAIDRNDDEMIDALVPLIEA